MRKPMKERRTGKRDEQAEEGVPTMDCTARESCTPIHQERECTGFQNCVFVGPEQLCICWTRTRTRKTQRRIEERESRRCKAGDVYVER